MRQTVEREVKLAPGDGFVMPELGGESLPTRSFVSTYHDTPELRLARHQITFRHRIEDGTGLWQLKIPRGDARLEIERAGPPAVPPPELLALLPAHVPGTRPGAGPGDPHRGGAAPRRLRAFLRAGRSLLQPEPTEALRGELGWLGAALGPARDLDVLIEHFRDESEAVGGRAADLVATLEARQADARTDVLETLGSGRYLRLLDSLDGFSHVPPLAAGDPTSLAAIWWNETKKLRRAVAALGENPADEDLHAVRIRVKRA